MPSPAVQHLFDVLQAAWRTARDAVAFLTIVPLAAPKAEEPAFLARAMAAFPLVGAAIGALSAVVLTLAVGCGVPTLVAAFLAVAAGTLLTGGLHEDGLADVADGLAGGHNRERRLAIMRDSRIGSAGATALIVVFGLRGAAVDAMATADAAAALIAAGAVSRAALVAIAGSVPAARPDGLAASAGRPGAATVAAAAGLAVVIAVAALGPGLGGATIVATGAAAGVVAWLGLHLLGGYTGDLLGATQQLVETAVLVVAAAR